MDQVRYGIVVRWHARVLVHIIIVFTLVVAISVTYLSLYTVPVTDAAAAPASSSQSSATTKTPEKPSSHVIGMYYACIKLSK